MTEHAWHDWLAAQEQRVQQQQHRRERVADLQRQRQLDVQNIAQLRRLLAESHALRRETTSPWACSTSGCPFQGKPMNHNCRCYTEAVRAHDKAVALKLKQEDGR